MNAVYEKLYTLLTDYNSHTNLTRITTPEDYYAKHIEDSLSVLKYLPAQSLRLIDVGTGAGFPGIPLAIERPDIQVALNDATRKKVTYLEKVKTELPLPNIIPLWGRAEVLGKQDNYRAQFDIATARAVAEIKILLELLAPLVKVGGRLILMKSKTAAAEITQAVAVAQRLKLRLETQDTFDLHGQTRTIAIYSKL